MFTLTETNIVNQFLHQSFLSFYFDFLCEGGQLQLFFLHFNLAQVFFEALVH
jgi:hypothetical protein